MAVLIPVANGSEDIETVTLIDVLRRAEVEVVVASVHAQPEITASRGTRITADALLDELDDNWDLVAMPGGMPGARHLAESDMLSELLRARHAQARPIAAICAAPALVLGAKGFLDHCAATCFPAFSDQVPNWRDEAVVVAGHYTTSQGPATAMGFALTLVEQACGAEKRKELAEQMLVTRWT